MFGPKTLKKNVFFSKFSRKLWGFWRDFCFDLPSQVSSKLRLLHGEVIGEDTFTQRERNEIKIEENKEMDKEK